MNQTEEMKFDLGSPNRSRRTISPYRELGAYEALWSEGKASFKSIAEKFKCQPGSIPSDFVSSEVAEETAQSVYQKLSAAGGAPFGVRVHGAAEYPEKLRDARHPVQLLYYQGWWDLINSRSVAVVGTRNPSAEGRKLAGEIVRFLVADDFTIVSGLARGIDTIAHTTALAADGRTYAVIGTPLSHSYPKDNRELQNEIARKFLLVSQVPVLHYESQNFHYNRQFFPERNKTMSALTEATIIVEAGETSGTLIQARAALEQKRKLIVLESCFRNRKLSWPNKFAEKGAIRVRNYKEIRDALSAEPYRD